MGTSLILRQANFKNKGVEGTAKYKLVSELLSLSVAENGKYIAVSDGTLTGIGGWCVSDFYDIPSGANMVGGFSNGYPTAAIIAFYDSGDSFISGIAGSESNFDSILETNKGMTKGYFKFSEIPTNAKKIRMCWGYGGALTERIIISSPYLTFLQSVK